MQRRDEGEADTLTDEVFRIAAEHLSEGSILASIQKWIKEDNIGFLSTTLEILDSPLTEIATALDRYEHLGVQPAELSLATQVGLRVALIRRLFTDEPEYIGHARNYLDIADFHELFQRVIVPLPEPRQAGRQERRPAPRPPRSSRNRPSTRRS